jgi:hypothetical protein
MLETCQHLKRSTRLSYPRRDFFKFRMKTQAHFGPEGKISRRNVAVVKSPALVHLLAFLHSGTAGRRAAVIHADFRQNSSEGYDGRDQTEDTLAGFCTLSTSAARGGVLAFAGSLLTALTILPASAQYGPPPWAYPYYHDYHGGYPSPPGPPGDEGSPGPDYPDSGYEAPPNFTVADVRRRVTRLGLHLVAKPRRKDNIFLAEAEDANGIAHRIVFDAGSGHLIENTKLPPRRNTAHKAAPEGGQ